MRARYFKILDLCAGYKDFYKKRILQAQQESRNQAAGMRLVAGGAVVLVVILGLLLAFVMARQILDPLHQLAQEADRERSPKSPENEIKTLSRRIHGLIEDTDQAHLEAANTCCRLKKWPWWASWPPGWPTAFEIRSLP